MHYELRLLGTGAVTLQPWSNFEEIPHVQGQKINPSKMVGCESDCFVKVEVLVTQLLPTLCNTMDCSPMGSSVHGIL